MIVSGPGRAIADIDTDRSWVTSTDGCSLHANVFVDE